MWKTIDEYPNYEVSDDGKVRNKKTGRLLKGREVGRTTPKNKSKYLRVAFNGKDFSIHRLVAVAFIPTVEGKNDVDHINGNKSDNRVENLRWVSKSENIRNAQDCGLKTYYSISRRVIASNGTDFTIFKSTAECADFFGVCHQYISKLARGKRKRKGYSFCYVDE